MPNNLIYNIGVAPHFAGLSCEKKIVVEIAVYGWFYGFVLILLDVI